MAKIKNIEEKPIELTEEQKKKAEESQKEYVKKLLTSRIKEVTHYMYLTKKKLNNVYNDIENKICGLSRRNRDFLTSFDRDFINSCFEKKYL